NNQQYDLSLSTSNIKEDYMKIIKEANKSELWTNFDIYEKYITQAETLSVAQILKAKEYFAKELIRIIVKNWKYKYPREQFEETEDNIADLMMKDHDRFELTDLKSRIRFTKNEYLQYYLSTLKIRRLRKIVQPPTKGEIEKLTNEKIYQNPLNQNNTFYTKEQPLEDKLFQINPIASRIFRRKNI
ncbi:16258_t:CDS:1, partial [Gigaspora margarita]